MPNILAIESSGKRCSVAILADGKLYSKETIGQRSHTEHLLSFIDELFETSGCDKTQLNAVAFSAGPGSFTGIRLASSIAKSFAYALDIPVVPVSTLKTAAFYHFSHHKSETVTVVSDARMGDVYYAVYKRQKSLLPDWAITVEQEDRLMRLEAFSQTMLSGEALITDNIELLSDNDHAETLEVLDIQLHAESVVRLAIGQLENGLYSSALQAQAIYLRDKTSWKNTEQQKKYKDNK